jgi:G3E family GTPase
MDHLFTLNEYTPKIKCTNRTDVDPSLLFGIDSKLFPLDSSYSSLNHSHSHSHSAADTHHHEQHNGSQHDEVETATILSEVPSHPLRQEALEIALASLPKDVVYRVKGFIHLIRPAGDAKNTAETAESKLEAHTVILNWAFGRFEITRLTPSTTDSVSVLAGSLRLTIMGERGEIRRKWAVRLAEALSGRVDS